MDTMELHLQINNALIETLKKTEVTMNQFNDSLAEAGKKFDNIGKTGEVVSEQYDDISKKSANIVTYANLWQRAIDGIRTLMSRIAAPFISIFSVAGIIDATKAVLSHGKAMRDLSFRMGDAGKSAKELESAMYDIAKVTGISTDNASELVGQLRRLRVSTSDISEMGIAAERFSEITGVAANNAGRLTGELIRTGRLGTQATTNILTNMARMQRTVGLTEGEMEGLTETIIESTRRLRQFGRSSDQIENFNKGVVRLAGGFAQVGVNAEEATKFVEALLDPGRIEENALLYAKLGISIEDAISGEVDPGLLTEKFRDLGQELQGMGGPAAAALARSLGMPLSQLRSMAEIDTSKLTGTTEELGEMFEEQLSPQDKFQKGMERLRTTVQEVIGKHLLPAVEKISGLLGEGGILKKGVWIAGGLALLAILFRVRKRFFGMATKFTNRLKEGVVETFEMGQRKREEITGRAPSRRGMRRTNVAERVMAGPGFAGMQEAATTFDVMAQSNLFPAVERMTENTAEWLRSISMGARPISMLSVLTEQRNKQIKERLEFFKQEDSILQERNKQLQEENGVTQQALSERINILEKIQSITGLTAEQNWELNKLTKESNALSRDRQKLEDASLKQQRRFEGVQENIIRRLGKEEQRNMVIELENRRNVLQTSIASANQRRQEISIEQQILTRQRDILEGSKEELAVAIRNGTATADQAVEYDRIVSSLNEMTIRGRSLTNETREIYEATKDQRKEIQGIEKDMSRIAHTTGRTTREIKNFDIPLRRSRVQRTMDFIGSGFRKAGATLTSAFDKVRQSARQMSTNIVERLKPSNWIKGIMARIRGGTERDIRANNRQMRSLNRGIGGLGGKFGKLLGVIGILVGALLSLEVVQKAIKAITDILKEVLKALEPAIITLVEALLPSLLRVLAALMPLIGVIVSFLLPALLVVLGSAIKIISFLVKGIGELVKFLMELPTRIKLAIRPGRETQEEIQAAIRAGVGQTQAYQKINETFQTLGSDLSSAADQIVMQGIEKFTDVEGRQEMQATFNNLGDKLTGLADNIEQNGIGSIRGEEDAGMPTAYGQGPTAAIIQAEGGRARIVEEANIENQQAIVAENTESTASSSHQTATNTDVMVEQNNRLFNRLGTFINNQENIMRELLRRREGGAPIITPSPPRESTGG